MASAIVGSLLTSCQCSWLPVNVHQPSSQSGTAPGRRRRGKVIGAPVRVRM